MHTNESERQIRTLEHKSRQTKKEYRYTTIQHEQSQKNKQIVKNKSDSIQDDPKNSATTNYHS